MNYLNEKNIRFLIIGQEKNEKKPTFMECYYPKDVFATVAEQFSTLEDKLKAEESDINGEIVRPFLERQVQSGSVDISQFGMSLVLGLLLRGEDEAPDEDQGYAVKFTYDENTRMRSEVEFARFQTSWLDDTVRALCGENYKPVVVTGTV